MYTSRDPVLLRVEGLCKDYSVRRGGSSLPLRAVDCVDLEIRRGETVALVGESGCGKSTLGRCIVQLERPSSGRVIFEGEDLTRLSERELRTRRRRLQMVFQDPGSSLTPRMTIGRLLAEPLRVHRLRSGPKARRERVVELLEMVGLDGTIVDRLPHEFSGGQRQRIAIARALAHEADFVVCDEAVSALDVSVQAQILALLKRLQSELGLAYLFITHDLAAASYLADQVGVMYLGRIIEIGPAPQVLTWPAHPYTDRLAAAVPVPDPFVARTPRDYGVVDEPASPLDRPSGCAFQPRCARRTPVCVAAVPDLVQVGQRGRSAACFWPIEVGADRNVRKIDDELAPNDSTGQATECAAKDE